MRVSTSSFYDSNIVAMQQQSAGLLKTQQQLASGRKIVSPADDPVAAAHALDLSQYQAVNDQYLANAATAADSLALEDSTLASITQLLQEVRDIAVSAGNPVLDQSNRASLASELRGTYEQLLGLANSVDGTGRYLFGGYKGGTRPFTESSPGVVQYAGDQGQRLIEVSPSRQIALSDAGDEVFRRIADGNGTFVTAAAGTNRGFAVIDSGTLLDASKWASAGNNRDFTIKFAVSGGITTYDIVDNVAGTSLLTGAAPGGAPYPRTYVNNGVIDFSQAGPPAFDFGAQVALTGAPANGDSFSVRASTSQDVFKTINDLVSLLQTPNSNAATTNGLTAAQRNIDNAIDNVLALRTSVGARLKELDAVKNVGEDRNLQYSQSLSRLQDIDYAQAASVLMQQQATLEAAQKSFLKVSGLSLFNYL